MFHVPNKLRYVSKSALGQSRKFRCVSRHQKAMKVRVNIVVSHALVDFLEISWKSLSSFFSAQEIRIIN